MKNHAKLLKQLALFGVVGGVSFLIDLTVTTSLYDFAHFPPYLAAGIGFLSAFFFNFPVNRKHVFNHSRSDRFSMKSQIIMYIALSVFNLFMTSLLMQLLVGSGLLHIGIAKVCVTALIAVWNFILFKLLIFSKRQTEDFDGLVLE